LIALLLVLLLAAGAASAGWWYGVGRYTTVPGLTQLKVADAQAKASSAHLHLAVGGEEWDPAVPAGETIDQSVPPGHRIERGGTVTVHVSKGKHTATFPAFDPSGKTSYDTYKTALQNAGLNVAPPVQAYSDSVPANGVISVDPAPNTVVDYGKAVTVTISKGPQPITINDYTGKPADEAQRALTAAGFKVNVKQDYSDTVPNGTVISQSPNSGTGVKGDTITLDVSKGQQLFPVPDVRGKKVKDAEKILKDAGFKWSVLAAPFGPGDVYDQNPEPGSMKAKGTTITLYVV
jgi:eukaryotic-like serine/threonine-protein kinase